MHKQAGENKQINKTQQLTNNLQNNIQSIPSFLYTDEWKPLH